MTHNFLDKIFRNSVNSRFLILLELKLQQPPDEESDEETPTNGNGNQDISIPSSQSLGPAKSIDTTSDIIKSKYLRPTYISSIFDKCPDRVITSITTKPKILQKTLFQRICSKLVKV